MHEKLMPMDLVYFHLVGKLVAGLISCTYIYVRKQMTMEWNVGRHHRNFFMLLCPDFDILIDFTFVNEYIHSDGGVLSKKQIRTYIEQDNNDDDER